MTLRQQSGSLFDRGDRVRYTAAAVREVKPPTKDVTGEVLEADEITVLVRWPMGQALERPRDLRKVRA